MLLINYKQNKLDTHLPVYTWIIPLLIIMSLTLALSEREQNLLTHANRTKLVILT